MIPTKPAEPEQLEYENGRPKLKKNGEPMKKRGRKKGEGPKRAKDLTFAQKKRINPETAYVAAYGRKLMQGLNLRIEILQKMVETDDYNIVFYKTKYNDDKGATRDKNIREWEARKLKDQTLLKGYREIKREFLAEVYGLFAPEDRKIGQVFIMRFVMGEQESTIRERLKMSPAVYHTTIRRIRQTYFDMEL